MNKNIKNFCIFAYNWSKYFIELLGLMLLCVLIACGINDLPVGIVVGIEDGNLSRLTQGDITYLLFALLLIYFVGMIVIVIKSLMKLVMNIKKESESKDGKGIAVVIRNWLKDN